MTEVSHPAGTLLLGHAEVRIPVRPGTMYAAPTLIWHYITTHRYRPPDDFIRPPKFTIAPGQQCQARGSRTTPTTWGSTESGTPTTPTTARIAQLSTCDLG